MAERATVRRPTFSVALAVLVAAVGANAGAAPLSDNSFLTHLATGRLILDHGFPRTDPYTFTAAGLSWQPQSWFASVVYAFAERVGDLAAIRLVVVASTLGLAVLLWRLTAPAGAVIGRLVVVLPALVIGADTWAERPLLFGLLGLAIALLAAEGAAPAWLLLPVGWVWCNAHGSWPLGLVALALLAAGRRLDGERPAVELRALAHLAGGLALGLLNPYGFQLLVFPFQLVGGRERTEGIVEWQAPTFDTPGQLAFIVLLAVAVVAIARRPTWRAVVPTVVFTAAALLSARNVTVAGLVLVPLAASGMRGLGSIDGDERSIRSTLVAALGAVLLLVAVAPVLTGSDFDDDAYPIAADAFMAREHLLPTEVTVVTHDYIGNWYEARYGPAARVFVDDRVEVLPLQVIHDYRLLLHGGAGWEEALARYDPEVVLWEKDAPLAQLLDLDPAWERIYVADEWAVYRSVTSVGDDGE